MRIAAILGLMIGFGAMMAARPATAAIAVGAVAPADAGAGPAYGLQHVGYWHHGHRWHHRRWSARYHHWIYW